MNKYFSLIAVGLTALLAGCDNKDAATNLSTSPKVAEASGKEVVVYTSVDQIFSEPVLKRFEEQTGIKVKALYDVEASKTVGLVNRLLAEKSNPQADVFWNSEVSRTIQLKNEGVLTPYQSEHWQHFPETFKDSEYYWTGFGARARVLIYNTDLVQESELPHSILDLTAPQWRAKSTMAYPLFGTTATHIAAMYASLGQDMTEEFLRHLKENEVVIVDGNGRTRDMVVEGEVPIGMTDTDDANVAIKQGKPVNTVYLDKDGFGTLLIPNTVALIKGAPHSTEGQLLIDYLLSAETEEMLAFGESAQMPLRSGVRKPDYIPDISEIKAMEVDYQAVADYIEQAAKFNQQLFVR